MRSVDIIFFDRQCISSLSCSLLRWFVSCLCTCSFSYFSLFIIRRIGL